MKKNNLFDLEYEELQQTVLDWGQPSYRASQIWEGAYQQDWIDFNEFTSLPLELRSLLSERFMLGSLNLEKKQLSSDGATRKFLYRLSDGKAIETVLMSYDDRQTVCISSQVGCPLACSFCATGSMGFTRNLSQGEIVEQVVKSAALLKSSGQSLSNVVFMGMGEPFLNYQAVLGAISILNDPRGFGLGARRFTVSTVGLIPGIKRFTAEKSQANLAISLHAADDRLRSRLLPINRQYPIPELMRACDLYLRATKRRITIEWALIAGVNDSPEQARKLTDLLAGKLYHVNLIQLNPVDHYGGAPAGDKQALGFQQILTSAGIPCTMRLRRGIDIQAGCGQLASKG
jgi:23S rRNA (adenine2503-C2)-methyltransferase